MTTKKDKSLIDQAKEQIDKAQAEYERMLKQEELKNSKRKTVTPPKYEVIPETKGEIIKKDLKFSVILTKTILYLFVTLILWGASATFLIDGASGKLSYGYFVLGFMLGMTAFISTILLIYELATKSLPLLFFKNNEKSLKNLLKITMFTLTGKIKQFYVKPSVDADFSYSKGLYVVDDGAKYWDGNYYNSYYVEGLPAPLKLKRTSNVQDYYKSVEKIKTALYKGEGWEEIKEKDIDNLISFSHSAKQLGEYKKDKIFTDMHKSKDGDKMLMAVMGFATVGFICMVVVVVLVLVMG